MKGGVLGQIAIVVQLGLVATGVAGSGCVDGTLDTYVRVEPTGIVSAVQVNTSCSCGSFTRTGSCSGGASGGLGGGDVPVNPNASCDCENTAQQIPVVILRDGTEIARGLNLQGNFAGDELVVEGHHAILPDTFPTPPQLGATDDGSVGWILSEPLPVLGTVTAFDGTGKTCREPPDANFMPAKWPSANTGGFVSVSAQRVVEGDGLHVWFEGTSSLTTGVGF